MSGVDKISRRNFIGAAGLVAAGVAAPKLWFPQAHAESLDSPLQQFGYGDVHFTGGLHDRQLDENLSLLMGLNEDSLLKPFRQMIGKPAPGNDLGGWYHYDPDYDYRTFDAGFAPSATFGQWVSALARMYAIKRLPEIREKVLRLNHLYAQTIDGKFYENNRFPAYCFDKLVCGLIDSHEFARDPDAFAILERTTDTALPHLPGRAIEHGRSWRPNTDESFTWDESYTNSENLFLAYQRGAGNRYRDLGIKYLDDDEYFNPLSEGRNVLAGRHAYSYVNALSSAMQAYLTLGSEKHLRAARNAFVMLTEQSFVTGGWGPDEMLRAPGSGEVNASLSTTHSSFETPCGSYAHFKLTRYLLRVTRDSRYGDSMERVMYNTILGAKPLQADGRSFYYADCNFRGRKVYCDHLWPCCSGTMPQVAADYRINTYFHDPAGVYVNLYIPSTVRWTQGGVQVALSQRSLYPFESLVQFNLEVSKPKEFAVNFRIPSWAVGASILVNGRKTDASPTPGTFVAIRRSWKSGDRVEVNLPLAMRLESVDASHSDTVGFLSGPLVLFAITEAQPRVTRAQLLSARKTGAQSWEVATEGSPISLLPFTAIDNEQYSTYLRVS